MVFFIPDGVLTDQTFQFERSIFSFQVEMVFLLGSEPSNKYIDRNMKTETL